MKKTEELCLRGKKRKKVEKNKEGFQESRKNRIFYKTEKCETRMDTHYKDKDIQMNIW